MIERNELRIQYLILRLEQKIIEEYKVQKEILQLELRKKLAVLYADDKEGYEKALKFSGVFIDPNKKEKTPIQVVKHKYTPSKL